LLNSYFDEESGFYYNGGTFVLVAMALGGAECETCCCELTKTEAGVSITPLGADGKEYRDNPIAETEHARLRDILEGRFNKDRKRIPDGQAKRPAREMLEDLELQAEIIRILFGVSAIGFVSKKTTTTTE